ncbi:MAG: hypothetical protein GXY05_01455 [Clostridiales bacterium]|mgnify:CR=1 FL=1|nr:hypothetical protein [Clostridiales bacterium]
MAFRLLTALGISLAATLALELLFAFVFRKRGKDLILVCLVNVLTNPAVVLIYILASTYTEFSPVLLKAALEAMAVLTEAYYYKRYGTCFPKPLLFSLSANAFSFFAGELISLIGG